MTQRFTLNVDGNFEKIRHYMCDGDFYIKFEGDSIEIIAGDSFGEVPQDPPKYQHDCDKCKFLGQAMDDKEFCDLYYCPQGGHIPTVIARYGNEPEDYRSGLPGVDGDYFLKIAKEKAVFFGYLPEDKK
jgi:hypothetical protein